MKRGATSQPHSIPILTPSLLSSTPRDSSIKAYNSRRIRSRSEKGSTQDLPQHHPKLIASGLGDIFQAADRVFRNSLAFKHPSQLTLPPCRREINKLWRSNLMIEDFQMSKSQQIRKSHYVSNYRLGLRSQWYKGRHL